MKTTVVNCIHNAYDIYIGRGSKWGNPYSHKPSVVPGVQYVSTREEAIAKFAEYIQTRPDLIAALPELRGKRLGCYCVPSACHGNILAALADETPLRRITEQQKQTGFIRWSSCDKYDHYNYKILWRTPEGNYIVADPDFDK